MVSRIVIKFLSSFRARRRKTTRTRPKSAPQKRLGLNSIVITHFRPLKRHVWVPVDINVFFYGQTKIHPHNSRFWALWPRERNYLLESAPGRRVLNQIINSPLGAFKGGLVCACARIRCERKRRGCGEQSDRTSKGQQEFPDSPAHRLLLAVAVPINFGS